MSLEISDKTKPTILDKKSETDFSTYLLAILILGVKGFYSYSDKE